MKNLLAVGYVHFVGGRGRAHSRLREQKKRRRERERERGKRQLKQPLGSRSNDTFKRGFNEPYVAL